MIDYFHSPLFAFGGPLVSTGRPLLLSPLDLDTLITPWSSLAQTLILPARACADLGPLGSRLHRLLQFSSGNAWIFVLQIPAGAGLYFSRPCLPGSPPSKHSLAWAFLLPVCACKGLRPPGPGLCRPFLFRSVAAGTFVLSSVLGWT